MASLLRFWRRSSPGPTDGAGLPRPDPTLHPVGGPSAERGPNQLALLRHWGLCSSDRVLEIGCGVGRLAYELASFLDGGTYTGFDISPKAIDWLNANYAPRLPDFRFDLVDARNVRYRPQGSDAETLRFPYADDQFDVACAFAVFMHMQLSEIRHYCAEIARVLTPNGFAAVTFRSVSEGEALPRTRDRDWVSVGDGVWTIFPETPGRALAYDDALVRSTIAESGLVVAGAATGRWHKRAVDPGAPTLGADVYVVRPAAAK